MSRLSTISLQKYCVAFEAQDHFNMQVQHVSVSQEEGVSSNDFGEKMLNVIYMAQGIGKKDVCSKVFVFNVLFLYSVLVMINGGVETAGIYINLYIYHRYDTLYMYN